MYPLRLRTAAYHAVTMGGIVAQRAGRLMAFWPCNHPALCFFIGTTSPGFLPVVGSIPTSPTKFHKRCKRSCPPNGAMGPHRYHHGASHVAQWAAVY